MTGIIPGSGGIATRPPIDWMARLAAEAAIEDAWPYWSRLSS
jgi:hypothetical protein